VTCTATYTVVQGDIDSPAIQATGILNGVSASGADKKGDPKKDEPPKIVVPVEKDKPSLKAAKALTAAVDKAGVAVPVADVLGARKAKAGDVLTYTLTGTNTGNVTMTGVVVSDVGFTGTGTAPKAGNCTAKAADGSAIAAAADGTFTLPPQGVVTCTATYTVVQGDIDSPAVQAKGLLNGVSVSGSGKNEEEPPIVVPVEKADPKASFAKTHTIASADAATMSKVGDLVTYSFAVTNTGNVTLTNLTIDDGTAWVDALTPGFTGTGTLSAITCPTTTLAPGASAICTATYKVTQPDLDKGSVNNVAKATLTAPSGTLLSATAADVVKGAPRTGVLAMVKSVTPMKAKAGDKVVFEFLVTNSTNLTVTKVTITEGAFDGKGTKGAITCSALPLAPGAHTTCTMDYTVSTADLGTLVNVATASGIDARGDTVTSKESSARLTVEAPLGPTPAPTPTPTPTPAPTPAPTPTPGIKTGGFVVSGPSAPAGGVLAFLLVSGGTAVLVPSWKRRHAA